MEVTQQCVVALTWTLKDTLGEELDVLDEPVEFLVGGDDLFKRIEEALQGHGVGTTLDLHLEPEEAFGDYDESLIFLEKRELFPEEIEEGMSFESSAMPKGTNPVLPICSTRSPKSIPSMWCWTATTRWPESPSACTSRSKPCEATEEEIGRGTAGTGFPYRAHGPGQ
jgi:FKBP-type peptidyl-prolyl cis-trans isomerase SlyD